jgi:hypothetical protein
VCFEHVEHWERIASRLETGLLIPSDKRTSQGVSPPAADPPLARIGTLPAEQMEDAGTQFCRLIVSVTVPSEAARLYDAVWSMGTQNRTPAS